MQGPLHGCEEDCSFSVLTACTCFVALHDNKLSSATQPSRPEPKKNVKRSKTIRFADKLDKERKRRKHRAKKGKSATRPTSLMASSTVRVPGSEAPSSTLVSCSTESEDNVGGRERCRKQYKKKDLPNASDYHKQESGHAGAIHGFTNS